jgi:hypothetical protein
MSVSKAEADFQDQKLFDLAAVPDSALWSHSATLTSLNLSHNLIDQVKCTLLIFICAVHGTSSNFYLHGSWH